MSRKSKKNPLQNNASSRLKDTAISASGDRCPAETLNFYAVPVVCVLLLLAVFLVFGQTLDHDFFNFDDNYYVYENLHVARGLTTEGITWAFTSFHSSNWHPLTWLSHMTDCQIFGLEPWGHHLTNVLLHAATAITLFLVLWRMTGSLWPSAFTAAVFAVHPLRVESVAWVAERKDVLSGLFFMFTLGAYLAYVRRPFSLPRYMVVVALFVMGLMSKPMLVTLPLVLLLLDYWPMSRTQNTTLKRLVIEKIPLFLLSAISCVVTVIAQGEAIASEYQISLSYRIGNAAVSYIAYIGQFFYPANLAVLYPHPGTDLSIWQAVASLILLTVICAVVVISRKRFPFLPVGWFWYLVMLLPVIGLVQVGYQAMADRYTYLPQIGLCIALVWGVAQLCRSWPYRNWVCGIGSAIVLAVLIDASWKQTTFWRDSETLWNHTLSCTTNNALVHNNLGVTLMNQGRLQEAVEQFDKVLAIKPNYPEAHSNLSIIMLETGRLNEAIEHGREAERLKPDHPKAHNTLGNVLLQAGRYDEAFKHFAQSVKLQPDYFKGHSNMALALLHLGRPQEAIAACIEALRIKPDFIVAYYYMAMAYAELNQPDKAIAAARKGIVLGQSTGQTEGAKQIEEWLNSYQKGESAGNGKKE
jgi:protein O-mannosyl-transferase